MLTLPSLLRFRLPAGRRICALFALACATVSAASEDPWPTVDSDLQPDPAAHFGRLPNGVRYAIYPNNEPGNRVSLRLVVAAGSLHERDYERGIAHFIEHMAFRGTRRHPGDTLPQELARLGIGFGPHSTAFTGYSSTTYHLDLPEASDAMLRRGLDVLREYAAEIAFDPTRINLERGIILGEKAQRDTAASRHAAAQLQFLFPSAREVRRAPIGLDESIAKFTRQQLIEFYDAWYRPERLAVIMVGNLTHAAAEAAVAELFGSLRARAGARDLPLDFHTSDTSEPGVRLWFDTGWGGVEFSLHHAIPDPVTADHRPRRSRELHRALAVAIMQRRLNALPHTADDVSIAPTARLITPLPGWVGIRLTAAGPLSNWKNSVAALEQEQRRALLHGFTAGEVSAAGAALLETYERAARAATTRPSAQIAAELENALVYGRVFATPAALRDDVATLIAAATPRECHEAIRALWGRQPPHVFVAGPADCTLRREDITAALAVSSAIPVERPVNRPPVTFSSTDPGPPGVLVGEEHAPDLDIRLASFANGLRLNFKTTAFEADNVLVRLRVGTGRLSLPRDQPGLDLVAAHTVIRSGVRRHSIDQLREVLAVNAISLGFAVEADACVFNARCAPAQLPLCLRIITAYLGDAAYRPAALREAHADFGTMYARLTESPSGHITFRAERTLVPDDLRFGIPEISEVFARSLAELSRWLEPQFKRGPLELAVVGDIAWPEAVKAVASTLGALGPREPRPADEPAAVTFAQPPNNPSVITTSPRHKQAAVAWFWPVQGQNDLRVYRRANFLAAVITERLRLRLREELGVAYAPTATFVQHESVPAFAYLCIFAEVANEQVVPAAAAIRREIDSIRAQGCGADEFLRVRQPFLRKREDDLRTNSYWCYTVLDDAQQRPSRLGAARDRTADSASITAAEIDDLARRYLDPAAGFMFVAEPGVTHLWGRK